MGKKLLGIVRMSLVPALVVAAASLGLASEHADAIESALAEIRAEQALKGGPGAATTLISDAGTSAKNSQALLRGNAEGLSPLAPSPEWSALEIFQGSMTGERFRRLLEDVYAPNGAWKDFISIQKDSATIKIKPNQDLFRLRFAANPESQVQPPLFWSTRRAPKNEPLPLEGLRIAIDPGHLGGEWARLEERWYQIGDNIPVTEGDMTLLTAQLLRQELTSRGAQVSLTREDSTPATGLRPETLAREAVKSLKQQGKQVNPQSIRKESEKLFYRTAEIRARADKVNKQLRPDIVLAVHFNAEPWGNPAKPSFVQANHLHLLVTGGFTRKELASEDQLFNMLWKLLNGSFAEEYGLAKSLAAAMSRQTGLPPYVYNASAPALRLKGSEYIWARNLLANRLFECPVIYLEPYVMNNQDVHARVQAADYEGRRMVNGKERESIYREYVRGVVDGLIAYYAKKS